MSSIDISLQQAREKADEWVAFLATYSDKRLSRRIDLIRQQQVIAEKTNNAKGFELMLLWEHITICARMYKEEHNIPDILDPIDEIYRLAKKLDTPKKKKKRFNDEESEQQPSAIEPDSKPMRSVKFKISEEDKDQMSLF